jgi:hypothetical protein
MVAPRAQEKGVRHSRNLGSVDHVNNEVAASGTIHVRKIGCFWVKFLDYGLDGLWPSLPSLAKAFPLSVGKRNLSMNRICSLPSFPNPLQLKRVTTLSTTTMMPPPQAPVPTSENNAPGS